MNNRTTIMTSFNITKMIQNSDKDPDLFENKDTAFTGVVGALFFLFVVTVFIVSALIYQKKRSDDMEAFLRHNVSPRTVSFESFKIYNEVCKENKVSHCKGNVNQQKSLLCGKYHGIQTEILSKRYCIVSFDETKSKDHSAMIDKCLSERTRDKGLEKQSIVVSKRGDVRKIPKCMVIVVFVDKNENDVIIEALGQERDLRLLTIKCCIVSKADVFVVYSGDSASENLMPGLLYNPQISCITEHPDLKKLEKRDRVITCYREFTITQREKIAEAIV